MGGIRYLPIINRDGSYKVAIKDICMIERENRKLRFLTERAEFVMYGKLESIAEYLGKEHFFKCVGGCIVNLDRIKSMSDMSVNFDTGLSHRLSRDAYVRMKQCFNAYLRSLLPESEEEDV